MRQLRHLPTPLRVYLGLMMLSSAAALTTLTTLIVWPGQIKLAAPLVCPVDRPEMFVVRESSPGPETGTQINLSPVCLDAAGNMTELGTWPTYIGVYLTHFALLGVLVGLFFGIRHIRRRRAAAVWPRRPDFLPPDTGHLG